MLSGSLILDLSCANLATGGDMYTKLNAISAASLISEGGVWYKVD